jgi:hypothetical protein
MDLGITTTTYAPVDQPDWLVSEHGTDMGETITIDLTSFADADLVNGYLASSTPIAWNANTSKYVKYVDGNADAGAVYGFLYGYTEVKSRDNVGTTIGTVLRHCYVDLSKVAAYSGITVAAADLPATILSRA